MTEIFFMDGTILKVKEDIIAVNAVLTRPVQQYPQTTPQNYNYWVQPTYGQPGQYPNHPATGIPYQNPPPSPPSGWITPPPPSLLTAVITDFDGDPKERLVALMTDNVLYAMACE